MLAAIENSFLCLERCGALKTLKQIHAQVFTNGLQHDNYLAVKLVSFCTKELEDISYARMIFDSLINSANVFLWTAMITSYSSRQSDIAREAILIYSMMHQHGPHPNNFTLSSVLKTCSSLKALCEGEQIHAHSTKLGFDSSIYVQTTLVDMYAKCGFIQESRDLFISMSNKNAVSCNAMIECYARAGDMESARGIFDEMSCRDSVSWTAMIFGYARHGSMLAARELFNQMPEKDVNSWNALIAGYSDSGQWTESIKLFNDMCLNLVKPNHVTMTILMSTCGQLGALKVARQYHGLLHKKRIQMNVFVYNSLVDMYAKCGNIDESYKVFLEIPIKDVVSYNVMIAGFANYGCGEDAVQLFTEMLEGGIQPDTVTFISILTACSQAGLLELGRHYFSRMKMDYGVEPSVNHFACMVDLFGRAGFIGEAYDLVKTMSDEPHAGVWGALLNACSKYCNVEIGEIAARKLFKIEPGNPGNYVLLSNIYAGANLWDGVKEVRCLMRGRGVAKMAGFSCIEVNGTVQEFLIGDATHPLCQETYEVLRHLYLQLVRTCF